MSFKAVQIKCGFRFLHNPITHQNISWTSFGFVRLLFDFSFKDFLEFLVVVFSCVWFFLCALIQCIVLICPALFLMSSPSNQLPAWPCIVPPVPCCSISLVWIYLLLCYLAFVGPVVCFRHVSSVLASSCQVLINFFVSSVLLRATLVFFYTHPSNKNLFLQPCLQYLEFGSTWGRARSLTCMS